MYIEACTSHCSKARRGEVQTGNTTNNDTEPQHKYDQKHPKQLATTSALVDFIADDLIPLSLVDSTRFKRFVHKLDPRYQLPSRKYLSTVLIKKKHEVVKATVNIVEFVSREFFHQNPNILLRYMFWEGYPKEVLQKLCYSRQI